jgi:hypothetical protein
MDMSEENIEATERDDHLRALDKRLAVNGMPHGGCYDSMRALIWLFRHAVTQRRLDKAVRAAVKLGIEDALKHGLAQVGNGRRQWTPKEVIAGIAVIAASPVAMAIIKTIGEWKKAVSQ